jgi:hypothetical protein
MDKVQLDQQIVAIQRSTRTTFPFMLPLHDRMRMGFRWYYNWHTKSYASKVHWGMLVVAFLIGISTVVSSLVSFPKKVTASYVVTVATTTGVSPTEIASQRVIVKASSGTLVAFYWEDSDNSIRYKKSTDSGWTWSSATSITTTAGSADVAGSDFSVKIDGSNNIYVAWTADTRITTPSFVKLTYTASPESWSTGTIYTVSLLNTVKDRPVVTVESGGRIWVAYKENLSAIRASYSDNSGQTWTLTTPGAFDGAVFELPISSTIDLRGGYPFIIWDAGEDRDGLCHYNTWNGSAWGADTAIANTVFAGCAAPAMVVTSGGTVYAWSGSDFGYYDGSWHAATDPGASNGSLTTDGTDVWAFWRDNTNNSLFFKKYTVASSSWDSSATFVASANYGEAQLMQSGSSTTLMPLIFYGTGEGTTMQVFYKNTGASAAPTAPVVTSPDGGETWGIGETKTVTWDKTEDGRKYEVGQRLLDQYDNFNDNSIDASWTKDDGSGLTIAETGNELKISGTSTALKTATLRSSNNTTVGADLIYQVKMKAPTAPPSGAWYGLQVHKAADTAGVRLTYSATGWDFSHYNGEWLSAGTTGALGNEGSSFITLKIVINRAAGKQYGYIITSSGEEIFIGASGENMGTNSRARLTAYVSAAAQTIDVRFEDYQLIPFNSVFSDTFDTETNGNPPANWTLSGDPTYGTVTVSNAQYVSPLNSMKVSKNTTSGTLRAYKTLSSAQTGVIVAEWDWRAAQTNVVLTNYLAGGGTVKTQVNFATSGYITYNYSGTLINIQAYSANTWYHMMIVADTQRQAYDIYIDGSLKASNIPFINAGTSLNVIDFRSANVTAGDFYVDNYQLYTDFKIISGLTATDAVSASWDTTGESAGTKYLARVRAYNDTTKFWGPYDYSNATFSLGNTPTAPSNVTLTNPSTSGMTVGWNDNSSDETGFKIERAQTTDCAGGSYAQIDTVGAGVITYAASGLSANTAYCFRVRAYNGYGDSSYATPTSPLYTLIETPTGISFDTITTSSLIMSATGSLSNLTAGTSGLWFDETSGNVGCSDSTGWTQTNSFTDDGLGPNVQCTYQVKARNGNSVETSYTATSSKYSLANPPINVSHSGNTIATITWTWQTNSNPAGTQFYAIDATGNSGWVADATSWASAGATANTPYTVTVKAKNGNGTETSTGTANAYTSIETPTGISFDTITTSSLIMSATGTLSNLATGSSGLWFDETSSNVGCSDSADWTNTNSFTDDGLGPNVQCTYQVKARNGNTDETPYTATSSKYTLANPPATVSHSGNTTSTITWTWSANSNPTGTQFYAIDATGNSGWVADAVSWASAGASANAPYTVTVKAKNGNGTETSTGTANAYTSIQTPTGISFDTIAADSLAISATGTLSNLTSGSSGLWFNETSSNPGGSDSADWTNINSFTDNGLSPNIQYKYTAKARNGDTDETPETAESAKYTLANAPGAPTVNTTSDISLTIIVDVNSNPSATQFAIYNETLNKWLKADGTLGATEVWQTYTQWGETGGIVNTGLTASTTYAYKVKGINGDGTETALSPAGSAATSATPTTTTTASPTTASTSSSVVATTTTAAGGNHAPVISHPLEDVSFCQQDTAYFVRNLPYYFVDPDHDPLSFSFTTIANTHLNVAILDGNYVEFSSKDKTWAGKENVTFSATDPSNASVSDTSQITVKSCPSPYGNHPPFITSTPPLSATATEQYTYQVTATDADGDTLTYQLLVSPDGMIIDPQTGLIKFIPTLDQIGDWYIIIKVSDGKGGEDTQKYWLKVKSPFLPIKIAKQIVNIPQNYVIKDLTRNIVAPAAVGTAVASIIALALALPIAFTDLPFLFMRLWALILSRFRKKRPPWGRVLDASDKKPIVGAIVRIYEAEFNKLKEMQVTDKEGRFGFMVKPGRYYVTVDKPGYVFRPNLVPGEGVYQGGVFEIKGNQPTVALDIYLEAIEKPLGKLRSMRLRLWHNIQYVMDKIDTPLIIVGSALALFAAWILPSPFNFLVVALYILMIGLKILLHYSFQRPFGRVYDRGNNQPIDLVTVRIFNSEKGTLSATKVTDKMGRFQFMVPVGVYYLMANKAGYGTFTTKPFAVNQKVGIINIDIRLEKEKGK